MRQRSFSKQSAQKSGPSARSIGPILERFAIWRKGSN